MRHRCNLTPVHNVYKVVTINSFSAPNRLNKLLEMHFKFPFNLIGKFTLGGAFLTEQSWLLLKSWYTIGGPDKGFLHCFADRLNQNFSFLCDSGYSQSLFVTIITNFVQQLNLWYCRKEFGQLGLRASSPIWASKASLVRTCERVAKLRVAEERGLGPLRLCPSLVRCRKACFARQIGELACRLLVN